MPFRAYQRDRSGRVLNLVWVWPLTPQQESDLQRLRNRLSQEKAERCPFCRSFGGAVCPGCLREIEYEVGRERRRMEAGGGQACT